MNWYEMCSDKELVDEINKLGFWDGELLVELVKRAFPGRENEDWECGDPICYEAAEALGYELD